MMSSSEWGRLSPKERERAWMAMSEAEREALRLELRSHRTENQGTGDGRAEVTATAGNPADSSPAPAPQMSGSHFPGEVTVPLPPVVAKLGSDATALSAGVGPPPLPDPESDWATFFRVVAVICFLAGGVGCFVALDNGANSAAIAAAGAGIVSALQLLFLAFLVDVFTDIRWHLAVLSREALEARSMAPTSPASGSR